MGGDARVVVGMLGVMAASEVKDFRIDFDSIDGGGLMAQGGGNVIAGARADDQHARVRWREAERQIVGILVLRLLQQLGVASQKIGREIHNALVTSVIDADITVVKVAIGKIV